MGRSARLRRATAGCGSLIGQDWTSPAVKIRVKCDKSLPSTPQHVLDCMRKRSFCLVQEKTAPLSSKKALTVVSPRIRRKQELIDHPMLRNCNQQASLSPESSVPVRKLSTKRRSFTFCCFEPSGKAERETTAPEGLGRFTFLLGCRPRLWFSNEEAFLDGNIRFGLHSPPTAQRPGGP